jgi:hypothetical protein
MITVTNPKMTNAKQIPNSDDAILRAETVFLRHLSLSKGQVLPSWFFHKLLSLTPMQPKSTPTGSYITTRK